MQMEPGLKNISPITKTAIITQNVNGNMTLNVGCCRNMKIVLFIAWHTLKKIEGGKYMFFITKNCACISDSGKAEYRNKGRSHEGMFKFRLLDDDGEIYFYGYSSSCDDEAAFEPLDYYGEAYGCTMIEYKDPETGEYEQL